MSNNINDDIVNLINSTKNFDINCKDSSKQDLKSTEFVKLFETADVLFIAEKYEKAISKLLEAKKLIPNDCGVNFKLGDIYQRLEYKKGSKCIEFYRDAYSCCKNSDPHYKLGEAILLIDDKSDDADCLIAESIARYRREIKDSQSNSDLLKFFGISLLYMGILKDSLLNLKESISINSKDYETFFYLGEVYDKIKNYEEAIKSYEESISLNPNNLFSLYRLAELNY